MIKWFINRNTKSLCYGLVVLLFNIGMLWSQTTSSHGKASEDSINSYLDMAWKLARSQPEEGLQLMAKIDSINNRTSSKFKEDIAWYYYGVLYRHTNQFDLSEEYFNKYEAYHLKKDHKWRVASVNMAKANLFSDLGNYEKSAEATALALKMYEAIPDTSGAVIAGNKLGYLLSEIERYEEALQYLREAQYLAQLLKSRREEANAYTNIAIVFEKKNMTDSALYYYQRAYKIGERLDDAYSKFNNRYNLSTIYQKRGHLDSAIYYGKQTIAISEKINVPSLTVVAKLLLSDLNIDQGNTYKAVSILEGITPEEMATLGIRNKIDKYETATKAYKQMGNYKGAFESLERFKQLSDSLTGIESRNKINELEIAYQTEKKEKQIELLDLKNKNSELQISRKNRTILIGGIALGLITLLSVLLYILIRQYVRQKKALAKALEEKSLLLKEIHHRVKNNLQLVSSLLTLQGQSITDDIALKAINEGKSRVRSMALIHQDLYQTDNITTVSAQTYLKKLCNELFETYNIKKDRISLVTRIEPLQIDVDTLIPIGLILNELITNALKYAFKDDDKGEIEIELEERDQRLILRVADDGVGYDLEKINSKSFGTKLIKSLIQQLDGELRIENNQGTNVEMIFKDYKISRNSKN